MYLEPEPVSDYSDVITAWETNYEADVAASATEMRIRKAVSMRNDNKICTSHVTLPDLCLLSRRNLGLDYLTILRSPGSQFQQGRALPDQVNSKPF